MNDDRYERLAHEAMSLGDVPLDRLSVEQLEVLQRLTEAVEARCLELDPGLRDTRN